MHHRLIHGRELARYFLEHGHVIVQDEFGQVIVCKRGDFEGLSTVINIPSNQLVPHNLLRYLLAQGGFTENEFWDAVG